METIEREYYCGLLNVCQVLETSDTGTRPDIYNSLSFFKPELKKENKKFEIIKRVFDKRVLSSNL